MTGVSVSIVVTNYNYAPYVRAALESALCQTHDDVEVIVVDDGSTDGSIAIIDEFGDRISRIHKPNGGQASAMNAGFAASRGDIVLFLDADDALRPEAAARLADGWGPDVAKLQFHLEVVDRDGRPLGAMLPQTTRFPADPARMLMRFGYYPSPPCSGNAYSRATLERLMPIPEFEMRLNADIHLMDLAPFLGRVISLPDCLGIYRVHGSNGSEVSRADLKIVRNSLALDASRAVRLRCWASQAEAPVSVDLFLGYPGHCKKRLISLRLDPEGHPFRNDGCWALVAHGVIASLTCPYLRPGKRLYSVIGFLLLGLSPASLVASRLSPLLNAFVRLKSWRWTSA
jgi:CTP:molybdopterin cytidylyltransferase MocA